MTGTTGPSDGGTTDGRAEDAPRRGVSRRTFLAAGGTLAAASVLPGCTRDGDRGAVPAAGPSATPQPGLRVPENEPVGGTLGRFLDPQQAATVTAIAARIIPGDAEDPGAVEAGAVEYIDRLLATHEGYPQRTYTSRPFAQTYDGVEPPPEDGVIWVHEDEIERYGWQSGLSPREIYRMGLPRLDVLAEQREGDTFAELDEDAQDGLLEAIEDGEDDDVTELFDELPSSTFFDLVRTHVVEGFLCDPIYGGNRDLVGWQMIGFPGSQRGYSPAEMIDPDFSRPPQGLAHLPMMHGGHHEDEHGEALGSLRRRHPNGPLD